MTLHLVTTVFLSQFLSVFSYITFDGYYERLTREDPLFQNFHPLNQAQFVEDDTQFSDEPNGGSLRFMVAPVQISIYNKTITSKHCQATLLQ
ncbi:hypothetical protein RB195_010634 [Necator americanus]|uniref:Uncharacterized protein n=1 Tax=Necator americanus TaxID=51031 RepID=A0ABR1CYX2_NECAM